MVGIDYDNVRLRKSMGREDIRTEILSLLRRNIDLAFPNMRENYQYLLAAGMKKLGDGSWINARKKCGIHGNYRLYVRRREMSSSLMESA